MFIHFNKIFNLFFLCHLVDDQASVEESVSKRKKLGPAGLDLHYANIIMQIDSLVSVLSLSVISNWFNGYIRFLNFDLQLLWLL